MGAVELLLVRHGESIGNVAAHEADAAHAEVIEVPVRDADVELSATGIEQSQAFGRLLAHWDLGQLPESVWSSPYTRAVETGRVALEVAKLELPIRVDERLRDRELGVLDLLTTRGVEARYPEEAARRRWLGKFYHRPPGGESWADLVLRVRSVLADLDAVEDGRRVLVVCHDAMVLIFRYVCEGLNEAEILEIARTDPVRNLSLTRLVCPSGEGWWKTDIYNDVSHLEAYDAPVTKHPGETDVHPQ
jgi:broad specificity phosphatase PhoE